MFKFNQIPTLSAFEWTPSNDMELIDLSFIRVRVHSSQLDD